MSDKLQCSEFTIVHQRPATGTPEQRLGLLLRQKSANRKRQREAELPEQRERRLQRQREYQRAYRRRRTAKTTEQTRMNVVTIGEHNISDCMNTQIVPASVDSENFKKLNI